MFHLMDIVKVIFHVLIYLYMANLVFAMSSPNSRQLRIPHCILRIKCVCLQFIFFGLIVYSREGEGSEDCLELLPQWI
jgi:hypothetical protein